MITPQLAARRLVESRHILVMGSRSIRHHVAFIEAATAAHAGTERLDLEYEDYGLLTLIRNNQAAARWSGTRS
jgi:hypothetical protein